MSDHKGKGTAVETGRLSNFIGGRNVETTDGTSTMLIDPSTGEEYLEAPVSGAKDVDLAMAAAAGGVPRVA